jgi:hypothetical protein
MPLRQRLDGRIEPNDLSWKSASLADRRWYYSQAGDLALERLKIQLSRGIGANGRLMKPRIQAVLPGGWDGPVMEPRYDASRVITLSDYSATDRSLLMWWHAGTGHASYRAAKKKHRAGKGTKPSPFGDILEYHQQGLVRGAPVRDVRLSQASIAQIKGEMARRWSAYVAKKKAKTRPTPKPRPQPPAAPAVPVEAPRPKTAAVPARGQHAVPLPKMAAPGTRTAHAVPLKPVPLPAPGNRPHAVPLRPSRDAAPPNPAAVD